MTIVISWTVPGSNGVLAYTITREDSGLAYAAAFGALKGIVESGGTPVNITDNEDSKSLLSSGCMS